MKFFLCLEGPTFERMTQVAITGSEIELIEPTNPDSSLARFLEKRGEGLHHICLEVDDIDAALADMQAKSAPVLDKQPRRAAEGRAIFLHPRGTNGGTVGIGGAGCLITGTAPTACEYTQLYNIPQRTILWQDHVNPWCYNSAKGLHYDGNHRRLA